MPQNDSLVAFKSKQPAVLRLYVQVMHKHTLTCNAGSNSWALHTCWHPLDISKHESELSHERFRLEACKYPKFPLSPSLEVNWPIPSVPALSCLLPLCCQVNRSFRAWLALQERVWSQEHDLIQSLLNSTWFIWFHILLLNTASTDLLFCMLLF